MMRTYILHGIFLAAVALVSDTIADHALAVADLKSPAPSLPVPVAEGAPSSPANQPVVRKIELPVNWQLTRSRLVGTSSSTVTETYRETWTLEIQAGGIYHLQSPRATVPAFVPAGNPTDSEAVTTALTVAESDFGRLIGVKRADPEAGTADGLDRPVVIQLTKQKRNDSEILLTWSEDEHYAVQLDFSPAVLF
jgi:hypothetical protein